MFVNQQKVTLISHMGDDLTTVNAARVSFGVHQDQLEPKDKKLIKYLADHKHFSTFEHCSATFRISTTLYISKQIMRHRTFSYNEISRRYTARDVEFYIPTQFRQQSKSNRQASGGNLDNLDNLAAFDLYARSCRESYDTYQVLLAKGVCREQARGVLPQTTMTHFYMTGNLRNWAHFLGLRLPKDAQGEIQEIAQMVRKELEQLYPVSLAALIPKEK